MSSPRILVLDGSLGFSIVAIVEERGDLYECVAEDYLYDQPLLQRITTLLPTQGERARLTGVVVGNGPGSYSGIRVAASVAVGIAAALGIPLRESASDRALWQAVQRPFSIALGTRESLEVQEFTSAVVTRDAASAPLEPVELRESGACAIVRGAGPIAHHVTLRYPAPARGSERA
jgi:tRNA A37 threonylcarbamoyladenosine modification protein TsaB